MKTVLIIPARFASSRYPGKPLAMIRQPQGGWKSLIQMTWETAQTVPGLSGVYVATDDDSIAKAAQSFGALVLMTSSQCRNGTERCAEAAEGIDADLIVNLQGDAPLTPPWFLSSLIETMRESTEIGVATPVLRCDAATYAMLKEDRAMGRVGGTTAVFDRSGHALYFSKEVIPFVADVQEGDRVPVFHHVGVYAYRPEVLRAYKHWPEGILEAKEGLEQLRFLENGVDVACVEVEAQGRVFWELNNPEDVARIEAALKEMAQ